MGYPSEDTFREARSHPVHIEDVMDEVRIERDRQDKKWGEQNHDDLYWLGILMEEVGEVAKAIIQHDHKEHIREEIIQTTAVAIAWLECMDRR